MLQEGKEAAIPLVSYNLKPLRSKMPDDIASCNCNASMKLCPSLEYYSFCYSVSCCVENSRQNKRVEMVYQNSLTSTHFHLNVVCYPKTNSIPRIFGFLWKFGFFFANCRVTCIVNILPN